MILVTGATGFIGGAVSARLVSDRGVFVRGAFRSASAELANGVERALVADLGARTDWSEALAGVDAVIHTAARVHVMRDRAYSPLDEFRRVNVTGTLNLARQAIDAGVRRFVFISSIKVNGEETLSGRPFKADDRPAPCDPYGISKWEAEEELRKLSAETGLVVVIIRPVLVYGPGVKGNFLQLMRWVRKGIPLPLGAIHNRRSLVALDNLVDFVVTALHHPAAANETFLVSDGEDISTTDLVRRIGKALGRSARLLPVPEAVLTSLAQFTGNAEVGRRLCGSLQVDILKARELLGWEPVMKVDEALARTATHFLGSPRARDSLASRVATDAR